jgi:hypothetical protein
MLPLSIASRTSKVPPAGIRTVRNSLAFRQFFPLCKSIAAGRAEERTKRPAICQVFVKKIQKILNVIGFVMTARE